MTNHFLKVEDLILATRTKHSEIKDNNKEFFFKIAKTYSS